MDHVSDNFIVYNCIFNKTLDGNTGYSRISFIQTPTDIICLPYPEFVLTEVTSIENHCRDLNFDKHLFVLSGNSY